VLSGCTTGQGSGDPELGTVSKLPVTVSANSLTVNDYAVLTGSDHDGEWTNFSKLGKSGGTSNRKFTDFFTNPVCHIANGNLTVDLGVPNNTALETMSGLGNDDSANVMFINLFKKEEFSLRLKKEGKDIYFVYVDKPVTLNGTISNEGSRSFAFDNLSLQTGWNIALVDVKTGNVLTFSNVTLDPTDSTCKWIIVES
jgi:hypothetical protein